MLVSTDAAYLTSMASNDAVALPNLVATAVGPNEIRLTWNVPAANGSTISGYTLQKWNGLTWTGLGNLLGTVSDVDAPTITLYIDTSGYATDGTVTDSMAPNKRYDYRIMATVNAGTASGFAFANATSHTDVPVRPVLTGRA